MCLLSVKDSLNNGFFLEKNGSAFLCSWQSTIGGGLTEAEMVGAERTKVGALQSYLVRATQAEVS